MLQHDAGSLILPRRGLMGQPELQWRPSDTRSFRTGSIQRLFTDAFGAISSSVLGSGAHGWGPTVPLVTDSWQATTTIDLSLQPAHYLVLGGNTTLAVANAGVGQQFVIIIQQAPSGGPYAITWFSTLSWMATASPYTAPNLPATASAYFCATFRCIAPSTYLGWWTGSSAV